MSEPAQERPDPDEPPPLPVGISITLDQQQALERRWEWKQRQNKAPVDTADAKLANDVYRTRRWTGYASGGIATLSVFVAVILTHYKLPFPNDPPTTPYGETWAIACLAAHALVTVGFIGFCVQLVRVAERMSIPQWWVREFKEVRAKLLPGPGGSEGPDVVELAKQLAGLKKNGDE